MDLETSGPDLVRGVAVLSVLVLLAVLLWLLPQPGYSWTRLVLFVLIAGAAVLGAAGVLARNVAATAVGIVGLVLLGFWQAVLSVFIWPVVALLALAALLDRDADRAAA